MPTVVGQASAAATSVAIPAHAAGDLIIVSARGTAAAPTVPAASGTVPAWVILQQGLANAMGLTVVAFVATGATTTTGAFINATHVAVLVLRPAASRRLQTSAARSAVGNGNNTQTIIYPALALANGGGAATSFGVRVGTRTVADSEVGTNIPAGWSNQTIQPAGASALMAVHVRAALAANPTADSIATAGSNAAYRAVTVEVEELLLTTDLAVSVAGDAAFDVTLNKLVTPAVSISDAAVVAAEMTVMPPPISFAIDLQTNQPYAGEHTVGEFLAGKEDVLAVDLQIVMIDFLDGLIAGQAQVAASLSVSHDLAVSITRQSAVIAQQALTRGLQASIDRAAAVTAQQAVTRGLGTVPIGGQSAVSADLSRVALSVDLAATIARAASVAPSLTVTNASFVNFDANVQGQAQVAAAAVKTVNLPTTVVGKATLTPGIQTTAAISFQALVVGKGDIAAETVRQRSLAATLARAAAVAVTPTVIRVVSFECRIENIFPICGEHLVGTFICGGGDGPHAVITAGVTRTLSWEVPIQGQAEIVSLLRPSTAMSSLIEGKANLQVELARRLSLQVTVGGQGEILSPLNLRLALASVIQGQAALAAKMRIAWLTETVPVDILLPPTTEASWILIPTTDGAVTLSPTEDESVALTATEEEDWLLVPTTERG